MRSLPNPNRFDSDEDYRMARAAWYSERESRYSAANLLREDGVTDTSDYGRNPIDTHEDDPF